MDVRLSPEQLDLRETAAQVVDRLGPKTVGDLGDAERAGRLHRAVEASGWLELRRAEGGTGPLASGVEVAVVAEELGRGLADVAYLGPVLAADLRRRAGAAAAEGETVVLAPGLDGLARAEPGQTPAGVVVDAARASGGLLLLTGRDGPGRHRLARVALDVGEGGPGQLDLTRPTAALPPAAAATAVPGAGSLDEDQLAGWSALALAATCADLVGVMSGAVALARSYAAERRQFGVPIGSFQAVQHLLADAHVATEGSRSVARHAAWAVDALVASEALAAATLAKAYCARAARQVCETVVQVHGGIGNTWDCLAHVFLRRALLSSDLLGGPEASLEKVLAHHGVAVPAGSGHGLR